MKGKRIALIAGSAVLVACLMAGAAFAAIGPNTAALEARIQRIEEAVANGTMSPGVADVLKQIDQLRLSVMEKLQADSQGIIDLAVADGTITKKGPTHSSPGAVVHPSDAAASRAAPGASRRKG